MSAALYLRLSREDGDKNESESISAQRLLLSEYCRKNRMEIYETYIDDGYGGTSFERPAFERMLSDAKKHLFDTVITKDMSRLGRDYIQTGDYVERIFPTLGVRYIAVNDGIDTAKASSANDMIPFWAVFNDLYAKDISKKVRASLTARRAAGIFIGSAAPYGYALDGKTRILVPNIECARVVLRIYTDYANGQSMRAIAKNLTAEGIFSPSKAKNPDKTGDDKWNSVMIKRILSNPTYCGNLTQGFVTKINYKVKKRKTLPENERITVEGTHEPIVPRELFDEVNRMLRTKNSNES